jgi:hypothetical protein
MFSSVSVPFSTLLELRNCTDARAAEDSRPSPCRADARRERRGTRCEYATAGMSRSRPRHDGVTSLWMDPHQPCRLGRNRHGFPSCRDGDVGENRHGRAAQVCPEQSTHRLSGGRFRRACRREDRSHGLPLPGHALACSTTGRVCRPRRGCSKSQLSLLVVHWVIALLLLRPSTQNPHSAVEFAKFPLKTCVLRRMKRDRITRSL